MPRIWAPAGKVCALPLNYCPAHSFSNGQPPFHRCKIRSCHWRRVAPCWVSLPFYCAVKLPPHPIPKNHHTVTFREELRETTYFCHMELSLFLGRAILVPVTWLAEEVWESHCIFLSLPAGSQIIKCWYIKSKTPSLALGTCTCLMQRDWDSWWRVELLAIQP